MTDLRRSRGFEPLGVAGARGLGLSVTRTTELTLQAAWRRVAGPVLSRRAVAIRIQRGVLELRVAEPAWRRAVVHLLPELGARMAREYPKLGVTRFRLLDGTNA